MPSLTALTTLPSISTAPLGNIVGGRRTSPTHQFLERAESLVVGLHVVRIGKCEHHLAADGRVGPPTEQQRSTAPAYPHHGECDKTPGPPWVIREMRTPPPPTRLAAARNGQHARRGDEHLANHKYDRDDQHHGGPCQVSHLLALETRPRHPRHHLSVALSRSIWIANRNCENDGRIPLKALGSITRRCLLRPNRETAKGRKREEEENRAPARPGEGHQRLSIVSRFRPFAISRFLQSDFASDDHRHRFLALDLSAGSYLSAWARSQPRDSSLRLAKSTCVWLVPRRGCPRSGPLRSTRRQSTAVPSVTTSTNSVTKSPLAAGHEFRGRRAGLTDEVIVVGDSFSFDLVVVLFAFGWREHLRQHRVVGQVVVSTSRIAPVPPKPPPATISSERPNWHQFVLVVGDDKRLRHQDQRNDHAEPADHTERPQAR